VKTDRSPKRFLKDEDDNNFDAYEEEAFSDDFDIDQRDNDYRKKKGDKSLRMSVESNERNMRVRTPSPKSTKKFTNNSLSRQFGECVQVARSPTQKENPTNNKINNSNNGRKFPDNNNTNSNVKLESVSNPKYVSILEIGCGNSLHSLRLESEMLHALNGGEKVQVIRINPNDTSDSISSKVRSTSIAIELGAKESLMALLYSMNSLTPSTSEGGAMQLDESS
jgi:hypothetical protein